jgi:hypothetical protein
MQVLDHRVQVEGLERFGIVEVLPHRDWTWTNAGAGSSGSAAPATSRTVKTVRAPAEANLVRGSRIFADRLPSVELLTGHEVGELAHTGDARTGQRG